MVEYSLDYYEKHLREYSRTAEQISKIRWDWVKELNPKRVIDYGSDVGWFRAWRPPGIEVDSYDIGAGPITGIKLKVYDIICFWDVLEHIENFTEIEVPVRLSNAVAGTCPLKPKDIEWNDWKHFKPKEHYHYFTEETLSALFGKFGFRLLKSGYPECPPRENILSFLYGREKP